MPSALTAKLSLFAPQQWVLAGSEPSTEPLWKAHSLCESKSDGISNIWRNFSPHPKRLTVLGGSLVLGFIDALMPGVFPAMLPSAAKRSRRWPRPPAAGGRGSSRAATGRAEERTSAYLERIVAALGEDIDAPGEAVRMPPDEA